jgi:hypothetical protein
MYDAIFSNNVTLYIIIQSIDFTLVCYLINPQTQLGYI